MRALALALFATGCGRLAFDPRGDGAGSDSRSDDGAADAFDACAIRQIGLGERHVCAVRGDGAIYCAGDNATAQLGTGAVSGPISTPVLATAFSATPPSSVVSVHPGIDFTCMLDAAGAAHCIGDNGNRQLGAVTGPTTNPSPVTVPVPPLRALSVGKAFGCGITTGDTIYCWGDADEGQAGNDTQANVHSPESVSGLTGMQLSSLATGSDHVCVLAGGARISCWGSGTLARLGYTPSETCPLATAGTIPCQDNPVDLGISTAARVVAGHEHTCMLTTSDQVECWGSNDNSQVGAPVSTQETRTLVANLSGAGAVVAGRHHNCALVPSSGVVACWGSSNFWELGSDTVDQASAIVVPLSRKAVAVATHPLARFTCAILDDGTAECWGANDFGQLGRGTMTTRELPGPFPVPCD